MKNTVFSTLVAFLLIVCVCTSCTQTQAQTKNEISTEKIASEISRSEILLSEKEHLSKVKAIIDETRVAYSKYDVIKISPNQSIQTSKFIHSSEKTSEELYFEYNEYLNSFNTVVLGVLKNIYGENVVTYNFEEGDNYIMPTYIVPDLNGSGFNSSKEAVENFRKNQGSASYDVIIMSYSFA